MNKIREYYNNLSPEVKEQIKEIVKVNQKQGWSAIRGFASIADIIYPCESIFDLWGRHMKEDRQASYIYYYVSSINFYNDFGYSLNKLIQKEYNNITNNSRKK